MDLKISSITDCHHFQVSRLRLLGDHVHSTRIAFVEFAMVSFYNSVDMFRLAQVTFLLGLLRILDNLCFICNWF